MPQRPEHQHWGSKYNFTVASGVMPGQFPRIKTQEINVALTARLGSDTGAAQGSISEDAEVHWPN